MSYKALISGVILLLMVSVILPNMLQPFTVSKTDQPQYIISMKSSIIDGINVPIVGNVKLPIGDNLRNYMANLLDGFSLIPPVISIPLILISAILIVYGIVKLISPFA